MGLLVPMGNNDSVIPRPSHNPFSVQCFGYMSPFVKLGSGICNFLKKPEFSRKVILLTSCAAQRLRKWGGGCLGHLP